MEPTQEEPLLPSVHPTALSPHDAACSPAQGQSSCQERQQPVLPDSAPGQEGQEGHQHLQENKVSGWF